MDYYRQYQQQCVNKDNKYYNSLISIEQKYKN